MKRIIQLIKWLLRAWPILIPILVGLIHYEINVCFGHYIETTNRIIGSLVQLLGGVLVLYSINENIGMFKRSSLFQMIWRWFKEIPIKRKNYVLHAEPLTMTVMLGEPTLTVTRKTTTLEERLNEIERRIEENKTLLFNSEKKLHERIDGVSSDLKKEITQNKGELGKLEQLLGSSVVGSIKLQVFGVLLVLYGAIMNLL